MVDTPTPIVVSSNAESEQGTEALVRQVLLVSIPIATFFGATKVTGLLQLLLAMSGSIATLVVLVIGQIQTRLTNRQLVVTARASPDETAVVTEKA